MTLTRPDLEEQRDQDRGEDQQDRRVGPAVGADAGDLARPQAAELRPLAPARGARRRRPSRASGARLRRRVPQYGHSVMYGDTSELHFLQTTKSSGPLATPPSLRRPLLRDGRFCDLAHDLVEIVVRLVDDLLPVGAVAAARAGRRSPRARRRSRGPRRAPRAGRRTPRGERLASARARSSGGRPSRRRARGARRSSGSRRASRTGTSASFSPASKCSASSLTIAWISAVERRACARPASARPSRGSRPCRSSGAGGRRTRGRCSPRSSSPRP